MDGVHPPPQAAASDHHHRGASYVRAYEAWEGSNIFGLRGRIIFGPDARSLLLTVLMIVVPIAIFCIFVGRKLLDDFPRPLGILIMVIPLVLTLSDLVFLLWTSGRDPGIIPRNISPQESEDYDVEGYQNEGGQFTGRRPSQLREVIINGVPVKIKYCDTCKLYRPPRCSHCSICDNCVERFDHHCPWVGQCIGLRNYRFFFMFVFCATLLCLYVFGFCWVYVAKIMDGKQISLWKALAKSPASTVLIVYSFLSMWFVGGLSIFHLYLIGTNQTTYEHFRLRHDRRMNPFDKGVIDNFKEVFLTSIPPSKNNFRAKIPKDPQFPSRRMYGSFTGQNTGKANAIVDIEMGSNPSLEASVKAPGSTDKVVSNDDQTEHGGGSVSEVGASKRIVDGANFITDGQISHPREDVFVSSKTSEPLAVIEIERRPTDGTAEADANDDDGESDKRWIG